MYPKPYPPPDPTQPYPRVQARISVSDYTLFRRLFPRSGAADKILATLLKHFINELRKHHLDPNNPDDVAWYVDSPSDLIAESILRGICGDAFGRPAGTSSGPDEPTPACGVCEADGHPPQQCPNPQGPAEIRRRSGEETKIPQSSKGPIQRGPCPSPPQVDGAGLARLPNEDYVDYLLRKKGII